MNNITIVGRLTKDPELKYLNTGTAVCTFDVAVDRGRKDKNGNNEVDFFRVETFGKTAEACANYTGKGCWIAVNGSSISDKYQDKNGNNRVSWKIRAGEIKFITYRDDNNQSNNGQFQQAPVNNGQPQFQQAPVNNGQPQFQQAPMNNGQPQFQQAPVNNGQPQFQQAPMNNGQPQFQQAPVNNGQPQFQQTPVNNGQPQWGAMDDIGDDDVPF